MAMSLNNSGDLSAARNVNPRLLLSTAPVFRQDPHAALRRSHGAWGKLDPRGAYWRFVRRLLQAA